MTNAEVLHQVEHGYRMQIPQSCPPALYDMYHVRMLAQGPTQKAHI